MGTQWSTEVTPRTVVPLALILLAILVVLDAGMSVQLSGAYSGAAVLASVGAAGRPTLAVGAVATAAAIVSGTWNHNLGATDWLLRTVVCAGISLLATLAASVSHRREIRLHNTTRLAQGMLDAVAGDLAGARTMNEVAESFVSSASRLLQLSSARVYVLGDDDVLRSAAWTGIVSGDGGTYDEFPLAADLPGSRVVRSGEALHYRSTKEIHAEIPLTRDYYMTEMSLHLLPLDAGGLRGLFVLTFPPAGIELWAQDSLVASLADALARALHRAQELEAADQEAQRLALLAEASVRLAGSLDVDSTLAEVTDLLVPRFADWCMVSMLDGERLDTVAVRHTDPELEAWAREVIAAHPLALSMDAGASNVVRTGRSELYPSIVIEQDHEREMPTEPAYLDLIRRLGLGSVVVAPLTGKGGVLGSVTLIHAESGRRFDEADVGFIEDVARRVAVALETATTFREQSGRLEDVRRVADAAQRAILAPLPQLIGSLAMSARYVSAASEALVGGDLYEVVLHDTAVRLLVGDVRGKGLAAVRTATIVMGEFRAAAEEVDDLGAVARQMDRRVRPHLSEEDFVTACIVEIDDQGRYSIASCGHPPPVVSGVQGLREVMIEPSLPLGLGSDPQLTTGRLELGERLMLFTDGLFEARTPSGGFVELLDVLAGVDSAPLDSALDDVLERLRAATGGELNDDLALLLVEHHGSADAHPVPDATDGEILGDHLEHHVVEQDLTADGRSAGEARSTLRSVVAADAWVDDALDDALLAVSELVTNVIVHTSEQPLLRVDVTTSCLRVEVGDACDRLPVVRIAPDSAQSGRGLQLVEAVVDRWGTEARPGAGKVVWFEIDRERATA